MTTPETSPPKAASLLFTIVLLVPVIIMVWSYPPPEASPTQRIDMRIYHWSAFSKVLPAGDDPEHVLAIGKRSGQAELTDGSRAVFENVYAMDAWRGKKTVVRSNIKLLFKDGSFIFIKNTTTSLPDDKGRLVGRGVGNIVGGGGRFHGISGRFESTAARAFPRSTDPRGARVVDATMIFNLP